MNDDKELVLQRKYKLHDVDILMKKIVPALEIIRVYWEISITPDYALLEVFVSLEENENE